MPAGPCSHLQRGPERRDVIWRVPRPLFPTLCMVHCQEGGEGETSGSVPGFCQAFNASGTFFTSLEHQGLTIEEFVMF